MFAPFTTLLRVFLPVMVVFTLSCEPQVPQAKVLVGSFREVGDFGFTDQRSRTVGNGDLDGKIWIANFIFTSCAAECLILSARFAELQRLFADDPRVAFVSFSVDPETDTPKRLGEFANRWHADPDRWLFLTGEVDQIDALVKDSFLLPLTRSAAEAAQLQSERFIHSNRFAVVDPSGTVRAYVDGLPEESVSTLSRIVVELLHEKRTPESPST